MAINTQKFLPAQKSSALAKIEPKGGELAKITPKTVSTQGFSSIFSGKTIKNIGIIKVKVIQIEKILKGTIALEKKSLDEKKRKESGTRREKQEEKLETKPNVEKGNIKMPSAPRLGILDWVKNFIGNIILGYFAVRLIDHLPKIMPIVKFLGAAADFIIDIGGKLLNGLVTFIDLGYKAYDATRGFIKNIGGENFAKGFDKFTGLIDTALFLTTVLAGSMAMEAMNNRDDSRSPGGDLGRKPTPGTQGRPKVTTSGGGGAGKPDIRNPLRQKPKVTTGGGGGKFKIPSGSSIKAGGIATLVMLIPDLISSGMLISQGRPKDGIRTFLSAVAAVGAGMAAIAGVTAGAAALGITGVGLPAAIALAIAGFAASSAASFLAYEGAEALLKKMGLVDNDPKTGKPYTYKGGGITRGGKTQGKIKRTIKKPKRTIRTLPSKVKPGQSIGGEKKIKNIFPEVKSEDKGKKINTYGYMKSSYEKLSSAEAFGGLFALPLKAQLGQEPSKLDYQNAASGLNSWMQRTFSSEIMRTGGVGFAEGGKVEAGMFSNGEDMTKVIEKSLEESISSKVTAAINDLKKQLGLKPNEGEGKDKKSGEPDTDETYGGGSSDAGDYKELLDMIAGHESTSAGGYLAYNEGGAADGYKIIGYSGPSGPNSPIKRKLTDMTVGEIMDHQDKKNPPIHAAGRYQIIGPTMRGLINAKSYGETGVSKKDKFDEATQDKLGIALIKYRLKTGATPENFVSEWRGLKFENRDKLQKAINKAKIGKIYKTGSSGSLSMGDGKFIQGNSGSSEGMHFHIGTNKPGDPSGPFDSGFQVAKHFLGKKSVYVGRSGEFIPAGAKDEEIKGYIKRGQAAHRQTELDLQIGGANGAGNKVAFPLALKNMTYSSNSGYGVKSDISGVNAFVGHGRYKPDGTVAPQDGSVSKRYSLGAPDFYAFRGKIGFASRDNMILKLHKGEMFKVVDKDSVDLFGTSLVQDIIDIENKSQLISRAPYIIEKLKQLSGYISPNDSQIAQSVSSKPDMSVLQSYAPYESGAEQTVVISREMIPIPILMGNPGSGGMIPSSSSSSVNTTYDRQFANA